MKINYDDPESQPDLMYEYNDAKNTVNITWQTLTERNFKKSTVAKSTVKRFSVVLAKSDKYAYFRVAHSDNIGAYIGIMYLKATFRVKLLNR